MHLRNFNYSPNGKSILKIEVDSGNRTQRNKLARGILYIEKMGSVPRKEEGTSARAGTMQLEQCGELCMNCSEKIEPLPWGLSQPWGAVCVLVMGIAEETGLENSFSLSVEQAVVMPTK